MSAPPSARYHKDRAHAVNAADAQMMPSPYTFIVFSAPLPSRVAASLAKISLKPRLIRLAQEVHARRVHIRVDHGAIIEALDLLNLND